MSVINKGGTGEDEPAGAQFRRVPLGRVRAPAPGPGAPPHPGRPVGVPGAAARLREQEAHPLVLQGALPRIQTLQPPRRCQGQKFNSKSQKCWLEKLIKFWIDN